MTSKEPQWSAWPVPDGIYWHLFAGDAEPKLREVREGYIYNFADEQGWPDDEYPEPGDRWLPVTPPPLPDGWVVKPEEHHG